MGENVSIPTQEDINIDKLSQNLLNCRCSFSPERRFTAQKHQTMKVTLEGALKSHNSNPFKLIQPEDLKADDNTRKYQISTDNIACTSDQIAMSKQETPSSRIDFYSTEDFSAKKQYST